MRETLNGLGTDTIGFFQANRDHKCLRIHFMRTLTLLIAMSVMALVTSCASVDSRVKKNQAAFDSWPADVQEKVRAGKVEVGFTSEMVQVALGNPDRLITRTTESGVTEGWVYEDQRPGLSFGLGMGTTRGSTAFGSSVSVGDNWRDREVLRVIFDGGKVTAIETRK
jgi:hypothetical protein